MLWGELHSQWSTSVDQDSQLFVCPGFYASIIPFENGQSIILGSYGNNINAQYLDEKGYKQWEQPIRILSNDSSQFLGYPTTNVLGTGDVLIAWVDHRGKNISDENGYLTAAFYGQRLNIKGQLAWKQDGICLIPAGTKYINYSLEPDGGNGFFVLYDDNRFHLPVAEKINRVFLRRFNYNGELLWSHQIDSSYNEFELKLEIEGRWDNKLLVRKNNYSYLLFDTSGNRTQLGPAHIDSTYLYIQNSCLFGMRYQLMPSNSDTIWENVTISKYSPPYELKWTTNKVKQFYTMWEENYGGKKVYFIGDMNGGGYFVIPVGNRTTQKNITRLIHFNSAGNTDWVNGFIGIDNFAALDAAVDKTGNIVLFNTINSTAAKYSMNGIPLWSNQPIQVMNEVETTHGKATAGDYNGGMIHAFWYTGGGIFAQHTGRAGSIGITKLQLDRNEDAGFQVFQNYPNPFNPITEIRYSLSQRNITSLVVFNVLGQSVAVLVNDLQEPGKHTVLFDGSKLSSGMYVYRLISGSFSQSHRMMLVK